MKVKIYVTLKEGVLDPQGKTVLHSLGSLGFEGVENVRIGKYIELEIDGDSESYKDNQINEMCNKILSNPIIEDYRIEKE